MTKFLCRRIALVSSVALGALAVASPAHAYGDPQQGCNDEVTQIRVAGATIYIAGIGSTMWVYLEQNDQPGLQRHDDNCQNPGASHDTVIASTRILCTCDYPFGDYPPLSLLP